MKTTRRFSWLTAATVFALSTGGPAQASLIGDSVEGVLGSNGLDVTQQFISPAIVGPGTEFSGQLRDSFFDLDFDIDVDLFASGFSVSVSDASGNGNGNLTGPNELMTISLTDLDWLPIAGEIVSVDLSDYTCVSTGISCIAGGGGPTITSLGSGPSSINFGTIVLRHGEVYTFDITAVHEVPEPSTLALFVIALGGLGFMMRRRVV